jgi:DKNYY family
MKYVIDGNRVSYFDDYYFTKPQPMPEADAGSFQAVGDWFAKDRRHVFFLYRVVEGADPASFVYLGGYNAQWAKDRDRAYYFSPSKTAGNMWAIDSASLDAFEILQHGKFSEYARDREFVYYLGKRVRGADAATFAILPSDRMGEASDAYSYHFAKDGARVYFDAKPIKDADYASFQVVHAPGTGNSEYGIDAFGAYRQNPHTGKAERISHDALPANVRAHLKL